MPMPNGKHSPFLSTPSARRATRKCDKERIRCKHISIHALREEGDYEISQMQRARERFLSTPSARRATESTLNAIKDAKFLSTPSARRATAKLTTARNNVNDFYPRPPRGGRLNESRNKLRSWRFLSTPSARRATGGHSPGSADRTISIHALREEGDHLGLQQHHDGR